MPMLSFRSVTYVFPLCLFLFTTCISHLVPHSFFFFPFVFLLTYLCVSVYTCTYVHHSPHVAVRGQLTELVLSLHHGDLRIELRLSI